MKNFKSIVAADLLSCINGLSDATNLTKDDIQNMFEYPPDSNLGDIAFPCFKLSRVLRKAPPVIAKEIADSFSSSVTSKVEAVNGYLNIFVSNEYLLKNVLFEIEDKKEAKVKKLTESNKIEKRKRNNDFCNSMTFIFRI